MIATCGGAAMTPLEHYTEAERLLSEASKVTSEQQADRLIARANVHALLANARPAPGSAGPLAPNRGRHNPPPAPRLHDLFE
jgi:hypothetical protein